MIELDSEDRLFGRLGDPADGAGAKLGGEPVRDPLLAADAFEVVVARPNNTDSTGKALVLLIRERLEQHSHFRGRTSLLQIELVEGAIVLSGRLPSHYLKQLLQEAIRPMLGIVDMTTECS